MNDYDKYYPKYLKYKDKYLKLQAQQGGVLGFSTPKLDYATTYLQNSYKAATKKEAPPPLKEEVTLGDDFKLYYCNKSIIEKLKKNPNFDTEKLSERQLNQIFGIYYTEEYRSRAYRLDNTTRTLFLEKIKNSCNENNVLSISMSDEELQKIDKESALLLVNTKISNLKADKNKQSRIISTNEQTLLDLLEILAEMKVSDINAVFTPEMENDEAVANQNISAAKAKIKEDDANILLEQANKTSLDSEIKALEMSISQKKPKNIQSGPTEDPTVIKSRQIEALFQEKIQKFKDTTNLEPNKENKAKMKEDATNFITKKMQDDAEAARKLAESNQKVDMASMLSTIPASGTKPEINTVTYQDVDIVLDTSYVYGTVVPNVTRLNDPKYKQPYINGKKIVANAINKYVKYYHPTFMPIDSFMVFQRANDNNNYRLIISHFWDDLSYPICQGSAGNAAAAAADDNDA